jgi:UDP-N-acetylmuramyl pentapeptide synthase
MCARKKNDFDLISQNLFCDIFIVTNIPSNHLDSFGNLENITNTKLKLKDYLINKNNFINRKKISETNFQLHNQKIIDMTMNILSITDSLNHNSFVPTKNKNNKISKFNGEIIDQTYNTHPKTIYKTIAIENPNKTTLILKDIAELDKNELNIHIDLLINLKEYEIFVTEKLI